MKIHECEDRLRVAESARDAAREASNRDIEEKRRLQLALARVKRERLDESLAHKMAGCVRRYWTLDNGGATYSVVAPTALYAMMCVLVAELGHGCTDDIVEISVTEVPELEARAKRIRGDGEPDVMLADMPMGEVACSEWPHEREELIGAWRRISGAVDPDDQLAFDEAARRERGAVDDPDPDR